jgi:hypothetical protein
MSVENSPDFTPFVQNQSGLRDFSLSKTENSSKHDISALNQAELLDLHAKVEARITGLRLSEVNLEKETLLQFQRAKTLQEKANDTKDVPVNQLAQVQNSIRTILESLGKMQMELHDSETIKRWKAALVRVVKAQPKEFQAAFFEQLDAAGQEVEQELQE